MHRGGPSTVLDDRVSAAEGQAGMLQGLPRRTLRLLPVAASLDSALALAGARERTSHRRDVVCAASRDVDRSIGGCDETCWRSSGCRCTRVARACCPVFCAGGSLPRASWRRGGGPVPGGVGNLAADHGSVCSWGAVVALLRARGRPVVGLAGGRRSEGRGAIPHDLTRGTARSWVVLAASGGEHGAGGLATSCDRSHGGCGTIGRYDLR